MIPLDISGNDLKKSIKGHSLIGRIAEKPFSGTVYLVGGAVRELLLNDVPGDYDLALTDMRDIAVLESLLGRPAFILGKKPIQTHRIVTDDTSFDITVIEGTIEEDLKRRDFTMNAIAYDIKTGLVVDILDGIADIRRKVIRYPARDSLVNDPLRMLKAVRHHATLTGFTLDGTLLQSMSELKALIKETAAERIKYEMDRIIIAQGVTEALATLDETGLLFEIFPELLALRLMDMERGFLLKTLGHTLDGFRYLHGLNGDIGLDEKTLRNTAYAFLFHDLGKAHTYSYDEQKGLVHFFHHERLSCELAGAVMERLRFSTQEMRAVIALIESHMRIFLVSNGEPTEKAVRRIVYKMGDLTPSLVLHTFCDLYGSSGGADNPSTEQVRQCCREVMAAYAESLKTPLPKLLSGDDLLALGFRQGPSIGTCLGEIRDRQIAGELTNREEALEYVETEMRRSVDVLKR